jgi:hypothetical protein
VFFDEIHGDAGTTKWLGHPADEPSHRCNVRERYDAAAAIADCSLPSRSRLRGVNGAGRGQMVGRTAPFLPSMTSCPSPRHRAHPPRGPPTRPVRARRQRTLAQRWRDQVGHCPRFRLGCPPGYSPSVLLTNDTAIVCPLPVADVLRLRNPGRSLILKNRWILQLVQKWSQHCSVQGRDATHLERLGGRRPGLASLGVRSEATLEIRTVLGITWGIRRGRKPPSDKAAVLPATGTAAGPDAQFGRAWLAAPTLRLPGRYPPDTSV